MASAYCVFHMKTPAFTCMYLQWQNFKGKTLHRFYGSADTNLAIPTTTLLMY